MDLLELAKRCEAAAADINVDPADALCRDIALATGWINKGYKRDAPYAWMDPKGSHHLRPPYFVTSLDAALTLMPEGAYWHVAKGKLSQHEPLGAAIVEINRQQVSICEAATVALATCAAALRARAAVADQSSGATI